MRTFLPAAPPTTTCQLPSCPIIPISFTVASAQFRGQPTAPIFNLCGVYIFSSRRSSSMPAFVESCTPKRQKSVPTHVFTMRTPFVYAWPDGIPKSAQICGKSAFFTPSKSMRWLPVIFTIGTLYFSATSAIRRNSLAEVTPPRIRGTTENVPSFWILACTRSLIKRAERSSS